ncbi:hypothetical protein YC2023_045872 [Brassica napus]
MEALAYVANIAGEHSLNWTDEAAMVEKFATDVSNKLHVTRSRDFEEIVGLQAHLRKLITLLCFECDEAKMIGIWGPAGIGKSTIARALFNHLSSDFRLTCFMGNLKGSYKSIMGVDDYDSKLGLQSQLLSKVLNQNDMRVHHLGAVKEWLHDQRVLIILDDVDDLEELDVLARELSWFGLGSRIIVTTEDKKILKAHGIQDVYHVGFPSEKEALEILCLSAFKQRYVQDDFEKVANRVAYLCGYLPLGLCVVGSSLRGESKEEWELQLSRIENNLDRKIEDILRVGYDRLSKKDQALFLHIACIFNNGRVDRVTSMLADSNMDVENGLKTLAIRSLVQLDIMYCKMHSLLQQLGRQVVHEQSDEPGKRQFLVEAEEIRDVLTKETGTGSVIGISFGMFMMGEFSISGRAFEGMRNLTFLEMYSSGGLRIAGDMEYLPHLRLLHWDVYPGKILPPTFQPQFLVELCMKFSNLEKLWGGIQLLPNLKTLNLDNSYWLKEIPNLSEATNLETVSFTYCTNLVELPSSIRNLHKLVELNMRGCEKLRIIPTNINLASLEYVTMNGCLRLRTFPDISRNIIRLDVRNTKIEDVPASVAESWLCLFRFYIGSKSVCFSFYKPKSDYITLDDCKCVKSEKDAIRVSSLFYNPVRGINLVNCLSLEEEARRVIIQQCDYKSVCLPGKEIPPEFTHRAKGNSITISSGTFSASSRFKACLLISPDAAKFRRGIVCRLISKGVVINELECNPIHHHPLLSEHLLVFSGALFKEHICCELDATTSEIRFEFNCKHIIECGVQMLADEGEIKLASSFHDPNREVRFINCMKLDEEARRAIVQRWAYKYVYFPGKEIPAEFTHKATGNLVTITKGTLSASTSFRACILLSPHLQHPPKYCYYIGCRLRSKERRCVDVDSDIHFEFSCDEELLKIVECGLQIMEYEGESSSREWKKQSDGAVKVSKDKYVFKTNTHTCRWSGLKKLVGPRKKKKNKRE